MKVNDAAGKRKLCLCIAFLLILGLFSFRLVNLDKDLPPWGIAFYQPIDEGAYSNMAINYKTYGTINPSTQETGGPETLLTGNFLTSVLGNLLTIGGFALFGNTYYGLRIGYVVISLMNLVLFYVTLDCLRRKYGKGSNSALTVMLAFLAWMVLDFSFLVNARVAEPSSSRLLFAQLVTIVFLSGKDEGIWKYAVMGFLTTVSVFFIYITNVFLYLACGLTLLVGWIKYGNKVFWKQVGSFVAGTAVAFALAEGYYIGLFQTEAVMNTLATVMSFGSNDVSVSAFTTVDSGAYGLLRMLLTVWKQFFSANCFIYNLPVLTVFILMIPMALRLVWKDKSLDIFFLYAMVFSLLLQTIVSYDCITRKQIVVFPAVIALMYLFILRAQDIGSVLRSIPCWKLGKKVLPKAVSVGIRVVVGALTLCVAWYTTFKCLHYRLEFFSETAADYSAGDKLTIAVLGLLPVLIALGVLGISAVRGIVLKLQGNGNMPLVSGVLCKKLGIFLFIVLLLCNTAFAVKYVWLYDSYTERDAMIDMAEVVDGQYVFGGGFQLGYTLYNDMMPIVSTSENTAPQIQQFENSLVLDYEYEADGVNDRMLYLYPNSEGLSFYTVASYDRAFTSFGQARRISLYNFLRE